MLTVDTRTETPFFRPPKQSRSRRTMDRLAAAALDIMEEEGMEGATVSAIVRRARSSVGSFYARFPAKEDLLRYLRQSVWTRARERWDQALAAQGWEGLPLSSLVEGVVGLLLLSFREDFRIRRALGSEGHRDPEALKLRLGFHSHVLDTVTPLFLSRRNEVKRPDLEAAVAFGYWVVVGAVRELLTLSHATVLAGEPVETLVPEVDPGPELARIWNAYLNPHGEGGPEEGGGEVDFFDPWG